MASNYVDYVQLIVPKLPAVLSFTDYVIKERKPKFYSEASLSEVSALHCVVK